MIDYTDRITRLMEDLVCRVPDLEHIDPTRLLVFARCGGPGASGPFATCHCLTLPPTDPGYFYWVDTANGRVTRRSPWFVTRTPSVVVDGRKVEYLISFALPRFCEQTLEKSRKAALYPGLDRWVAKLDTIVHELYHIDPRRAGIRLATRVDGTPGAGSHGHDFLECVAAIVKRYLAGHPDPATYEFLRFTFAELTARYGGVVAATFRTFPSFPQRYAEALARQPASPGCPQIQPIPARRMPISYTERDLVVREFLADRRGVARPPEAAARARTAACRTLDGEAAMAVASAHDADRR